MLTFELDAHTIAHAHKHTHHVQTHHTHTHTHTHTNTHMHMHTPHDTQTRPRALPPSHPLAPSSLFFAPPLLRPPFLPPASAPSPPAPLPLNLSTYVVLPAMLSAIHCFRDANTPTCEIVDTCACMRARARDAGTFSPTHTHTPSLVHTHLHSSALALHGCARRCAWKCSGAHLLCEAVFLRPRSWLPLPAAVLSGGLLLHHPDAHHFQRVDPLGHYIVQDGLQSRTPW